MIVAKALRKAYREGEAQVPVLRGVDLEVAAGELVVISGPSGAGKSSLLHILGGLDRAYEGAVEIEGRDLARLSERELAAFRNQQVGFVFQSYNLLDPLTVLENVLLPTHFTKEAGPEALAQAQAALERVGLADKARRRPPALSGGERQRVALARAIFRRPRLVLADEPTGALDASASEGVIALLRELGERDGAAVIVASHEPSVWSAATRRVDLCDGLLEAV